MTRLLFRLPPWLYWIVGVLLLALAYFAYEDLKNDRAAALTALAAPPPAPVAYEAFDEARHVSPAKETVVLARIDFDRAFVRVDEDSDKVDDWIAPLLPTDGSTPEGGPKIILLELSGDIPTEALEGWMTDEPGVFRLHGERATPLPGLRSDIEEYLAERGMAAPQDVFFLDPFLKSREEELAPSDPATIALLIAGAGGLLLIYGFVRRAARRRRA